MQRAKLFLSWSFLIVGFIFAVVIGPSTKVTADDEIVIEADCTCWVYTYDTGKKTFLYKGLWTTYTGDDGNPRGYCDPANCK